VAIAQAHGSLSRCGQSALMGSADSAAQLPTAHCWSAGCTVGRCGFALQVKLHTENLPACAAPDDALLEVSSANFKQAQVCLSRPSALLWMHCLLRVRCLLSAFHSALLLSDGRLWVELTTVRATTEYSSAAPVGLPTAQCCRRR
jgi:hypothetical protein